MAGMIDVVTGKSGRQAKKAQALQQQQQSVANARQLSTAASESAREGIVRRNPRGRRLMADAGPSTLPTTVA